MLLFQDKLAATGGANLMGLKGGVGQMTFMNI